MKFRWSEWLTAAALIFAFSAFAGADIAHDAAPAGRHPGQGW